MQVRQVCFTLFLTIFMFLYTVSLAAEIERGVFAMGTYSPVGFSIMGRVPYNYEPKGSADTKPDPDAKISSLSDYSLGAGYFRGPLMADFQFYSTSVEDQKIDFEEYFRNESIEYTLRTFDIRSGLRLSDYGNPSFTYIHLGYRYLSYSSDYLKTELSGHGFTVGLTKFHTFFPRFDFEPALYFNAYLGNYRITGFESDMSSGDYEREKSVTAGGTLGIGVHFEPYNLAVLAIVRGAIDQISHNVRIDDGWVDCGVRHTGFYAGIAVMYQRYNFKHNR
ncbi:MAG: hypothetical protein PF637_12640 [Spirochaetes bacterium]|nr:hypothetical protein [Spirochaetota bacterium]